jgi:hypothetical protein
VQSQTPQTPPDVDRKADFVIWNEDLQSFLGNPILVELKTTLPRDPSWYAKALDRIGESAGASMLVLYWSGDPFDRPKSARSNELVVLSIRDLVAGLESATFAEVVRSAWKAEQRLEATDANSC